MLKQIVLCCLLHHVRGTCINSAKNCQSEWSTWSECDPCSETRSKSLSILRPRHGQGKYCPSAKVVAEPCQPSEACPQANCDAMMFRCLGTGTNAFSFNTPLCTWLSKTAVRFQWRTFYTQMTAFWFPSRVCTILDIPTILMQRISFEISTVCSMLVLVPRCTIANALPAGGGGWQHARLHWLFYNFRGVLAVKASMQRRKRLRRLFRWSWLHWGRDWGFQAVCQRMRIFDPAALRWTTGLGLQHIDRLDQCILFVTSHWLPNHLHI